MGNAAVAQHQPKGTKNAPAAHAAPAADAGKKQTVFALKNNYEDGKKSKLQLFCKQQADGGFKVWAIHAKAGSKKARGMVKVFAEQAAAVAHFDQIVAQCVKQGWKQTLQSAKSAFEVIPAAE